MKGVMICLAVMALIIPARADGGMTDEHGVKSKNETIVLLHGIGHVSVHMGMAHLALKKRGYKIISVTYPSQFKDIDGNADVLRDALEKRQVWENESRVHFVTHSLGGLVTRRYLEKYRDEIPAAKLGRVVMLAPPHQGSEVANFLKNIPPYRWVFGKAGQELTTEVQENTPKDEPYYELGIIAGSLGWPYVIANMLFDGEHDGRVAVERTKLPGMKDHITRPVTHSFISWHKGVHDQIEHFLEQGVFK